MAVQEAGTIAKINNKNRYVRLTQTINTRRLQTLPPRPLHSTTYVSDNVVLLYPVDKANYSNPMYPTDDDDTVRESQPVQATDGADSIENSHIATNAPSRHRSIFRQDAQESIFNTDVERRDTLAGASRVSNTGSSGSFSSTTSTHQRSSASRETNSNAPIGRTRDSTVHIPKPPRYPDYITLANRKASFQTPLWSLTGKPNVDTLAMYGFFFTGNTDLVRCFQCGIGLKDWIRDDDVLSEHIKHSTDCMYLYQKFGKTEIDRLKGALTGQGADVPASSPLSYRIRSPQYQTMESRIASFSSFPPHLLLEPRAMSVAGLYYTGTGDLCRCFACDGGLKDWSTGDDPIKEHATYFPHCPYINQLKGPDYVARMKPTRRSNNISRATNNGTISQNSNQGAGNYRETSTGSNEGASSSSSNQRMPSTGSYREATSTSQGNNHGARLQGANNSAIMSMDRLSIENNPSSAFTSQVFQQLGYSEADVVNARLELETQGNKNPTSEDIVNAILDNQEKIARCAETGTSAHGENDLQAIVEENERLLEMVQCMLCVTGEPDVLFLPCAHHRICHACAESLTQCPICDKNIKEKVKTFRS